MNNTIVGVDLAKNVIQVCVYANKKVQSNTELLTQTNVLLSGIPGDYLNGADTIRKKPKINLNTMTYHYDSEPDGVATVCRSV